ncbi:uncharacterized protein LOC131155088 isoform X2 [Malania oleifera]|uniref:uncharacterized protein LOC131155088 isoform X2 n=1 Tax=Malania oleifera TaxID=397392 RepID=UPI0025AEB04C|nr:uncharacterized protein LOC131155088 isoform X2 [Malania oleifera]
MVSSFSSFFSILGFKFSLGVRQKIMASSLNGLTVGDPLSENLMESPARSESMFYTRDDISLQYSPMSEDSDESRFCETHVNACSSQPDSIPTSPVSPYRSQRPLGGFSSTPPVTSYPPYGSTLSAAAYSQPRQRGSDSEGRFPSSPSDICHSADLRRAALLRSVQMRTQPPSPSAFELSFNSGQEAMPNIEAEERQCSYMKTLVDERVYQIEDCSTMGGPEPEINQKKSCRALDVNVKGEEPGDKTLQEMGNGSDQL